jgi:hypothetical protein
MIWFLIKSLLFALFGLYLSFGAVAIIYVIISCGIFNLVKNNYVSSIPILISILLGAVCWSFMGMYFATIAFTLTTDMKLWLSITVMAIYTILVMFQTHSTAQNLLRKTSKINSYRDFLKPDGSVNNMAFSKHLIANFFSSNIFILLSFVTFLFLHNYSDKLTFGLMGFVLSSVK